MDGEYDAVPEEVVSELNWHLHLEWMRAAIRKALVDGRSTRDIAAEMGVSVGSVRTFLLGRHLWEESYPPFASWCAGRECDRFHVEQAALAALVADHPQYARPFVRGSIARTIKHDYISRRDRVPQWITDELATWELLKPRSNRYPSVRP